MAALGKRRSWDEFVDWCRTHGVKAAPAHPWTVAAYVRTASPSMRLDALRKHLGNIGSMHYERLRTRPDRHPIVKRTLESLRRERDEAKKPKPPALFKPEDFVEEKTPTPKKARAKPAAPKKGAKAKTATKTKPKTATKPKRSLRATPKLVRRKRV